MAKSLTFLLVDDDAEDAAIFEEVINEISPPINLISAVNGLDALEKLKAEITSLPDLIFLDLNMPRMDGKECLRELKDDMALRHIPVMMYTTSSQSKDIEETMMSGAVCFITKPNSVKELKNILSSIANSLPHNLERSLRQLSQDENSFIIC